MWAEGTCYQARAMSIASINRLFAGDFLQGFELISHVVMHQTVRQYRIGICCRYFGAGVEVITVYLADKIRVFQ